MNMKWTLAALNEFVYWYEICITRSNAMFPNKMVNFHGLSGILKLI